MLALDELIGLCDATQVRHVMQVIEPQFQRDFISLLPKEVVVFDIKLPFFSLEIIISMKLCVRTCSFK